MIPSETLGAAPRPASHPSDWKELTKPRILFMVLVTAAFGAYVAEGGVPSLLLLGALLVGTGLLAGGASALNQVWERDTDARMARTANRPLPTGRISPEAAIAFGLAMSLAGVVTLAAGTNLLTAGVGLASLLSYVLVYTPLKRKTSLSTVVGAVPGALPPVMGWVAVTGSLDLGAAVLFGILFLWQMPHFLAIAWLCREDYAAAGFPMLPVVEPDGRSTGRQTILYALALLPVSLMPATLGLGGSIYFVGALVLGLIFLGFSIAFSRAFSMRAARRLMLASIVYLPALLVVMVLDSLV